MARRLPVVERRLNQDQAEAPGRDGPMARPVALFTGPWTDLSLEELVQKAAEWGFHHAACGPMVRSSYHADQQAHEAGVV